MIHESAVLVPIGLTRAGFHAFQLFCTTDGEDKARNVAKGPKRPYTTPTLTRYASIGEPPTHLKGLATEILARQPFSVMVDEERRFVSVPEEFGQLE